MALYVNIEKLLGPSRGLLSGPQNQWNNITYINMWVRFLISRRIKNNKPLGDITFP